MTNKISTNKHGFTIIEVVLVLAIAGLIFLMVFVALPALQKGQRDTQRKNDVGRAITALTNYTANGGAALQNANSTSAISSYLGEFKSPGSGSAYDDSVVVLTATGAQGVASGDELTVYTNAYCSSGTQANYKKGDGYYAVVVSLEGGTTYCQDNS